MDKQFCRSRGYGFVTFTDPASALAAVAEPNKIIDGRVTEVEGGNLVPSVARIHTASCGWLLGAQAVTCGIARVFMLVYMAGVFGI